MIVRNAEQRRDVIEAGKRLGEVLEKVAKATHAGVSTASLDALSEKLIRDGGDTPAFKGFKPDGARSPYPATCCISVNEEVVHGLPGARILKEGDIVSLDLGLIHDGYVMDSALTVPVGKIAKEVQELLNVTQESLEEAIAVARPGARVGDISHAVEETFKGSGFSIVKVLGGHGVGNSVHEEPFIPNVGHPGMGPEIVEGMVLALEPIANAGKASVFVAPDGFTYKSKDGSMSAHFEHTILVEKNKTIVLTRRPHE
ncbi:type I methionyl aminopeptidase [Patescibacteria group bacterium]|nr:type I methionyl aminopeptidase [Patescibacteria group bacterium]